MLLSENEIKIIKLIRESKAFSKISITKKSNKDKTEFQVEVKASSLFARDLDSSPESLL